jgi:hypothetical protein
VEEGIGCLLYMTLVHLASIMCKWWLRLLPSVQFDKDNAGDRGSHKSLMRAMLHLTRPWLQVLLLT